MQANDSRTSPPETRPAGGPKAWLRFAAACARGVGLAALALAGGQAMALDCYQIGGPLTIVAPTLTFPADAYPGAVIGGWLPAVARNDLIECGGSISEKVSISLQPALPRMGTMTASVDGKNYPVFQTGVPGVGVIFSWTGLAEVGTCGADLPLGTSPDYTCSINGTAFGLPRYKYGASIKAAFVKTGDVVPGLRWPSASSVAAQVMGYSTLGFDYGAVKNTITIQWPLTTGPVGSCLSSDVVVPMGTHQTSAFHGPSSVVGERDFSIPLKNCPAGLESISYVLRATDGAVGAPTAGVAKLTPASTATGVGVRVTAPDGTVIGFSSVIEFEAYRTGGALAGDYAIALKAAYIQTAPTVSAGKAEANMEIMIFYD